MIKSIVDSGKPFHVVFFEDLQLQPIEEIRKIVEFLPLQELKPDNLEDRLQCMSLQLTGRFKRNRKRNFDPYDEDSKLEINTYIQQIRDILKQKDIELPRYENWFANKSQNLQ